MAHFELGTGETSIAVGHKTVEEIWFVLKGWSEMWRNQGDDEEDVALKPGICLTIPAGTHFQFRNLGEEALANLGLTMPPLPGEDDAFEVEGKWEATVGGGKALRATRRRLLPL